MHQNNDYNIQESNPGLSDLVVKTPVRIPVATSSITSTPPPPSQITATATPDLSINQMTNVLQVTQTPTMPAGWAPHTYQLPEYLKYLNYTDLVFDAGGIILDAFTVGLGDKAPNALQTIGKGWNLLSVTNTFGSNGANYGSTSTDDWYDYGNFAVSVWGLVGPPFLPDAIGISLNIVHANFLANQNTP
jgi:hypothetical protein